MRTRLLVPSRLRSGSSMVRGALALAGLALLAVAVDSAPVVAGFPAQREASPPEAALAGPSTWVLGEQQGQRVGAARVLISLVLSTPTAVSVGDMLAVDLRVEAGAQPVDMVEAYLNFDRNALRLVNPTTGQEVAEGGDIQGVAVTPNPASTLRTIQRRVSNSRGLADYAAIAGIEGPVSGSFVAATFHFKVIAATSGSQISLNSTAPRITEAMQFGEPISQPGVGVVVVVR